jgi:hypothetical protein
MSLESIIIKCPKCGRKMPSYRDICFTCSGVEVREAQEFVDEAKKNAPKKLQRVSDERVAEIAASLEHLRDVLPGDSWHLGASLKVHDTRYRDKDPFAYMTIKAAGDHNKMQPVPEGKELHEEDMKNTLLEQSLESIVRMHNREFDRRMNDPHRDYFPKDINEAIEMAECEAITNSVDVENNKYDNIYLVQLLHEVYVDEGIPARLQYQLASEEESLQFNQDAPTPIMSKISQFANRYAFYRAGEWISVDDEISILKARGEQESTEELEKIFKFKITYKTLIKDAVKKDIAWEKLLTEGVKDLLAISVKNHITARLFPTSNGDTQRHRCPECAKEGINVSADEFGQCPYGHGHIYNNSRANRGSLRRTRGIDVFHIEGRDVFRSWTEEPQPMPMITLIYPWDMERQNFRGYVAKKHGGPTSIIINPIAQRTRTPDMAKFIKDGVITKEVEQLQLGQPCECGCHTRISDLKTGDTVCPNCGAMTGRFKNPMRPEPTRKEYIPQHNNFRYSVDIKQLAYEVSDEAWE